CQAYYGGAEVAAHHALRQGKTLIITTSYSNQPWTVGNVDLVWALRSATLDGQPIALQHQQYPERTHADHFSGKGGHERLRLVSKLDLPPGAYELELTY